ncbi:MAG: hypothetical protein HQL42_13045 [Alphaproteobacteria bacterium]|nr:hypothetical protein [Alphaproteobacteria bacterium]
MEQIDDDGLDVDLVRVVLTSGANAGMELSIWQAVEITRGLDQCASSFSVSVGRGRLQESGMSSLPIQAGDGVTVLIGNDPVVNGWVEKVTRSRTAEAHGINIQGRSITGDLVECSAMNKPGQWTGARFDRILKDLVEPFAMPVVVDPAAASSIVPNFEIEQGDTVFEAVEKLARFRGLVVHDSPSGAVKIIHPGRVVVDDVLRHRDGPDGQPDPTNNVLESEFSDDMTKRFSLVTVKGQGGGGKSKVGPMGQAQDHAVARYRPLIVKAESEASAGYCRDRANWEVARRAGKSRHLTHAVKGWRRADGQLWDIDLVVQVEDHNAEIWTKMLVIGVKYSLDKNGQRALLTLEPPEAWLPQPFMDKASGGGGAKWKSVEAHIANARKKEAP